MNNKKITHVLVFFSILFLSLVVYLTTIEFYYKDEYAASSYNQRAMAKEDNHLRGTIYDRNGKILAYSKIDNGEQKRYYPFLNMYSHVIGYSTKTYGKSLIERNFNTQLLGTDSVNSIFNIKELLNGEITKGSDLYLTIDHGTQNVAYHKMGRYNGALVAMNPKTGEIIAMVSKPDFNPNQTYLTKNWESLSNDENSPFFTRATMGLYPPGSTFKMVTSALAFESGFDGFTVNDQGVFEVGDKKISNTKNKAYGEIGIEKAFNVSSNVYFSNIGIEMGQDMLSDIADRLMFGKNLGFDLPYNKSRFQHTKMTDGEIAITSIGQGKTMVTPLHLCMITSCIANNGDMKTPYIVSEVRSGDYTLSSTRSKTLTQAIDPVVCSNIKELMLDVVNTGTGYNARIRGIEVAGKTGTAENEKTIEDPSKTHAVFVAFAPYDDPQIAVAVILEYSGSTGGTAAAPIARDVIYEYLSK